MSHHLSFSPSFKPIPSDMELNDKGARKPGAIGPLVGPERPERAATRLPFSSPGHLIRQQRKDLPVFGVREKLVSELDNNSTVIIIGETGCGKSTQIPQFLLENKLNSDKMIAITQPRRLAATSLSRRVALEMDCKVSEMVGYSIRFDEKASKSTKIIYLTEGMLLREALSDNLLLKYSVIILDEAHERNINTDLLFGIVKKAQALRSKKERIQLKIVVMSATMDVDHFSKYFDKAPVVYIEGRQFPINIYHAKEPQPGRIFSVLCTVRQINEEEPDGDILVFLSGSEEIEAMVRSIESLAQLVKAGVRQMRPFPVYAALPTKQLDNIFRPVGANERKIIVATNVAETSITIPGIKYVVDSGLVKAKSYEPLTGLELLKEQNISKAQAWQRAGRAGRESSGTCYRTYTKQEFDNLVDFPVPEIMRCNLASAILMMAGMGIDAYTFDFMSKPSKELMDAAVDQLVLLGALESKENRKLTELGEKMTDFPLDPDLAKVILSAKHYECVEEILSLVAVLSGESVFHRPSSESERNKANDAHDKFLSSEGDHVTLVNIYRQFSSASNKKFWCEANYMNHRNLKFAASIREQLSARLRQAGIPLSSCGQQTDRVRKCLVTGLFTKVAQLQRDKKYQTVSHRQIVAIHPSSSLRNLYPSYVLYSEIVQTSKSYLRNVSVVDPDWLREIAPEYFRIHRIGNDLTNIGH